MQKLFLNIRKSSPTIYKKIKYNNKGSITKWVLLQEYKDGIPWYTIKKKPHKYISLSLNIKIHNRVIKII